MLKTVATLGANGALTYLGTWNASTNTPTLTSSVGLANNYYVVSVAGTTNLNGITNWQVGDWAIFNGSVWERIEGGASESFANLTVTGTGNIVNLVSGNVAITGGTINNLSTAIPVASGGTGQTTFASGAILFGANTSGINTNTNWQINGAGALLLNSQPGTSGQVVTSSGATAAPTWTTLGTMSSQNANNVAITGGTINVQTVNHTTTTTSNATMSTASIPLVPQGYLEYDLNGTVVKIPYYAV